MEASLVPDTVLEDWTIAHDDDDIIVGSGGRVAFTSRKAFEAAGEDLVVRGRGWSWGLSVNSQSVQLMSLTPNSHVLILDEAWSWKFSDECPQMNSAEDGRAVLDKLLRGRITPAQRAFSHKVSNYQFFLQTTLERRLCYLTNLREAWELYRQADKWSPNNRSDDEGNLVVEPDHEWYWVLTSLETNPIDWVLSEGFPPNTELMVMEAASPSLVLIWEPEPVTRTVPDYLMTLSD